MPDMTGLELAQQMLKLRGDIPVILITGYGETVSPARARNAGVRELVMKPLARQELAEVVRHVLDSGKQLA